MNLVDFLLKKQPNEAEQNQKNIDEMLKVSDMLQS